MFSMCICVCLVLCFLQTLTEILSVQWDVVLKTCFKCVGVFVWLYVTYRHWLRYFLSNGMSCRRHVLYVYMCLFGFMFPTDTD